MKTVLPTLINRIASRIPIVAVTIAFSCSVAQATVFNGVMDNRAGFPNVPGFTAQSLAWIVGGNRGEGLRLEWQADDVTTPGFWTYNYKLVRGSARNKGFAYFDIETADDFSAADITGRQVLSANNLLNIPIPLAGITISDPVPFTAVHDFSNAAISEANSATVLSKSDLSHYSGDPGRTATGQPGGAASATPSAGPVAHPFKGIRVTFPGSFASLSYVASDWEFRIVSNRVPMWGSFFGWGDQTVIPPFWYSNFYSDNIGPPEIGQPPITRLSLAPANSLTGAPPYRGWILVPGPLPTVVSSNPSDSSVDVPFTEPVTAVFGGLMDPATISTGTFTLTNNGISVPGTVSYDAAALTATFTPSTQLATGSTYIATITSGPGGVKDLAGNPLIPDKVWSFTTGAADLTPPTVTAQLPPDGAGNIAISVSATAVFGEAIDPVTLSVDNFRLADASGPLTGSVSYNAATRTATFTPNAPLANNSLYTATISIGVRDRAGNPLTQDKVWSFTTIPQETILPVITATAPTSGAGNVSTFSPVTAAFSENMDPATINNLTFTLTGITGTVSYDGATRTASFTPDAPLSNNTTYTATISTAVKDLAGNRLPLARVWSFTTGPPDFVPPTVISTQPTAAATNVPLVTTISAVFSEPMGLASIGQASFTLTGRTYASTAPFTVSGTISNNTFIPIAQFIPAAPLIIGTAYTATITTAVTDQAGNHLAVDKTWTFVTLPDGILSPGNTAPTIADALRILRISVNLIPASSDDMNHGDVAPLGQDGKPLPDGIINIQDALVILRKVVGLISW